MSSKEYEVLLDDLARFNLLEELSKNKAEEKFINDYEFLNNAYVASDSEAIETFKELFKIKSDDQIDNFKKARKLNSNKLFLNYAHFVNKKKLIINDMMKGQGESIFLKLKDRLDRVLYSILRVNDNNKAFDLYYSIESKEIEFGDAAKQHSQGPENKTQGIVGPVDLTTPHPDIAARLRTAKPRQLFPPFKLDQDYAILRLEYRFDSEYNETTLNYLGNVVLKSKIKPDLISIYKELLGSNN